MDILGIWYVLDSQRLLDLFLPSARPAVDVGFLVPVACSIPLNQRVRRTPSLLKSWFLLPFLSPECNCA